MEIKKITEDSFKQYGRVLTNDYDVADLILALKKTQAPEDSVIYVPSVEEFEELPIGKVIKDSLFGGMPIQIGYCNGMNHLLNGVEYHRNSEFGVAGTDLILLLGKLQDVTADFTYDSSKIEAFLVPEGTVYEMYGTTLHYAPCSVDGKVFRNIVALPKGTNTVITDRVSGAKEDKLMKAKNKWLIAHKDAGKPGAYVGIIGENITI
ncbi:MAG: DUF4867 family protein [Herbinix sp.]|nr:DUF4867 family protein [Herbinix sp.]